MTSNPEAKRRRASMKTRPSKEGGAHETKAKILDVAIKVFTEHGFDGSTLRGIAAQAGVNHAMLGYYFLDKEALWKDAVTQMFQRLQADLTNGEASEELGSSEDFRDYLKRYIKYCARHPEHARLMVQESVRGGPRLEWAVETFIRPGHIFRDKYTRAQVQNGHLPDIWPISLRYIIVAICQIPFMLGAEVQVLFGIDMQSDAAIEAHTEAVTTLLLGPDPCKSPDKAAWPKSQPGS